MKLHLIFFLALLALFPNTIFAKEQLSFTKDIKPILDNRCVTCHSCYNSPCQLKLSSFEGLIRGASKEDIYANRLTAVEPSRLFVDAKTEEQWREKDFFSVTNHFKDSEKSNESIMLRLLEEKQKNPLNKGDYSPETDELACVKNQKELDDYLKENPHKAMPYGFPALNKKEHKLLSSWLESNSFVDDKKNIISKLEKEQIQKYEEFFNNQKMKYQVTARYIYEHLFLAHLSFDNSSKNFFQLVRSRTKTGEIDIIPTRFPYSKIEEKFYYRIQPITSTIVHKTHMVYTLDDKRLKTYKELFINTAWLEKPYMPAFDTKVSANALKTFKQIPAKSRYKFLLDNIHYFIMTYIRGPVCKGQIALNVINDHFWVMFIDPEADVSVKDKNYLDENLKNLSIPNKYGATPDLLETFTIIKNYQQAKIYFENRNKIYSKYYPQGLGLKELWKGNEYNDNKNDSILTIYRHFDSASVHKGALGDIPKTMWVIDFPLIERLYYSLVAGFDVFGSTSHQFLVRKHMDRLRIEGETNFLEFLPKDSRKEYFNSWYKGWLAKRLSLYVPSNNEPNINYQTNDYKEEFTDKLFSYLDIKKDPINFIDKEYIPVKILKEYENKEQIEQTFKTLTLPNNSKFIQYHTDDKTNLAYIRIELKNGENLIYTMVINRWHDNVALMFDEDSRLNPKKDRINFIEGFIGSYPNIFVKVKQKDLNEFFHLIYDYQGTDEQKELILKYIINRANPNFWDEYDWFTNEFKKQDELQFGLFDLNRYYQKAIDNFR
ncbi:peptidylprolyl isomerase [Arcobacter sp. CECT 8989]|uniref:fatty acid cis/trans isomerase n=1 Tax=Arcobacter sp. CECT 8989 TaxID=2044509 RepID=UPI00100A6FE5|nr:fatty acid cis/trans isomerase [Arcobacter sp. CECT 8989]RXK02290.1 peptidylprolyl isomerase [Arcobacter sp. CECT 8989]